MTFWETLLLAVALSMDAVAVSVANSLAYRCKAREMAAMPLLFGGFQGLMPLVGWLLGVRFQNAITSVDHWIAFVLLTAIGVNMIRESRGDAEHLDDSFQPGAMLPLALATSIDALAVGVTFAFLQVEQAEIVSAVSFIGVITFVLSAVGVKVGAVFGARFRSRAELAGGLILILMGLKILLEHTVLS